MATLTPKHKPYPAYRPSGVEWLGDVPAHWEVARLKSHVANIADHTDECGADEIYLALENVEGWTGKLLEVGNDASFDSQVKRFQVGDLLFGKLRPYLAKVTSPNCNGVCVSEFFVLRGRSDGFMPKYLECLLLSKPTIDAINGATFGAKMPRADWQFMGGMNQPLPPLAEQTAIAAFLDRETTKIDALVAKKERLIELLQEKRTALISRAVTIGLDPEAPTKDSDIEWLGEIPAHWEVRRLKHSTQKIGSGKTPKGGAERYVDDGVMFLRSQNVHFGGLQLADVAYIDTNTDNEMSGSRVREGDVLLNITGASLGRSCVARLGGADANVNQHVCILRTDQRQDDPDFLAYSIESQSLQDQIFNNENGVSRDALNFEQIGDLLFSRPAIAEQIAIATFLDQETAKLDNLIAKVNQAVKLLKEKRSALISAAVTGQIDVREEARCM